MPLIPAHRKQRQSHLCEFDVSLAFMVSSRATRTTHRETLSQKPSITSFIAWYMFKFFSKFWLLVDYLKHLESKLLLPSHELFALITVSLLKRNILLTQRSISWFLGLDPGLLEACLAKSLPTHILKGTATRLAHIVSLTQQQKTN